MTWALAWRNTRLHLRKRLPVGLFLITAMALLFIGNSVFSNTDEGLGATYRDSLTGELTISARSSDPFTLFGSELPLIGEYFKNPLLPRFADLSYRIQRELPEAQTLPVLIGAGKLSLGDFDEPAAFFGARFGDYFRFFPSLKLLRGSLPQPGSPGILINQRLYDRVVNSLGREPELGERFLFAAVLDSSFVLRELPFEGVYAYPVSDQLLDRVVLIDDDTARALNGYYGSSAEVPQGEEDLISKDSLDDLFATSEDLLTEPTDGISLEQVSDELKTSAGPASVDQSSWNFLLVRGGQAATRATQAKVQAALTRDDLMVQVRDWRDSAGGNARVVWFLQWMFNVGLIFISLVASLIVMNSLSLSVVERTREIGTMRALGAERGLVGRLIGYETVILVAGAGLVGIVLGVVVLGIASSLGGIPIDNPLLAALFGSNLYKPRVQVNLVLIHAGLGVALGLVSMILPILKATKVAPVQAMARE